MNDLELTDTWTALEPTVHQRRRIETRVFTWIEAHDTSLAAEWLALFKGAPITTVALAAASAAGIAAAPLIFFARVLM